MFVSINQPCDELVTCPGCALRLPEDAEVGCRISGKKKKDGWMDLFLEIQFYSLTLETKYHEQFLLLKLIFQISELSTSMFSH